MALLVLKGRNGESILTHSGALFPPPRKAIAAGHWPDVWKRVDERRDHIPDAGKVAGSV